MDKSQFIVVWSNNKHLGPTGFLFLLLALIAQVSYGQSFSGKSNSLKIEIKNPQASKKQLKPTVKWVYPSDTQETLEELSTTIKLGINSQSALVKITLIINDETVNTIESFDQSEFESGYLFDTWIEQPIVLAQGVNNVTLVVENELGALQHKRKLEVKLNPRERKDYALIVGTDEYNSRRNLNGPIRDAEKLASELEQKGFQIDLIRDATTFDILDRFEHYAKKEYGPNDQLLVYFVGYGFFEAQSGKGYLVCKNSINTREVNGTYLSYDVIKSILNNIPVPHIFLLVDAVKGKGESLPLSRNHQLFTKGNGASTDEINGHATTRIGLLSGLEEYKWNSINTEGSPLSRAFITYMNKSTAQPFSWVELMEEFEKINPRPIYVEFGDHVPGNQFTFK